MEPPRDLPARRSLNLTRQIDADSSLNARRSCSWALTILLMLLLAVLFASHPRNSVASDCIDYAAYAHVEGYAAASMYNAWVVAADGRVARVPDDLRSGTVLI